MSKVAIKGNASGTGTFTLEAPNSNVDRTLTLPDEAGTVLTSASTLSSSNLSGALPALDGSALTGVSGGKILQVVNDHKTTIFTTATAFPSFTDITGSTLNITPASTSSRILIMYTGNFGASAANYIIGLRLKQVIGGTTTYPSLGALTNSETPASLAGSVSGTGQTEAFCFTYIASPATTSQVTYTMQLGVESGVTGMIGGHWDNSAAYLLRTPTMFTLMEIES